MNNYNNFKSIEQHFSSVMPESGELITRDHIKNASSAITEEIKALIKNHKLELENIWSFFCSEAGVKARIPRRVRKKDVRRVLEKSVKKACFTYDQTHCFDKDFLYTSNRLVKQHKLFNGYSLYSHYLFSYADNKRFYATASRHLTESVGLASLALKEGLKPVKVTLTLMPEYHRSSYAWCGITANESAKFLTKTISNLYQRARNNKLSLEYIRRLEPHEDGTPHLHAEMFTDDVEKLEELIRKAVADNPEVGDYEIEESENVYADILYTLKDEWPPVDEDEATDYETITGYKDKVKKKADGERKMLWKKSLSSRCFSKASNVRKLPSVALWDAFRKDRFNAKHEIHAVNTLEERIYLTEHDHVSGESFVQLSDYSRHLDRSDAFDSITSRLTLAVRGGDYAEFTRVFTIATNSRKRSIFNKTTGLETSGSLGRREISAITDLTTMLQVDKEFGKKIRDIEDLRYLLRTKKWHGIPDEYKERQKNVDKFMKNFKTSQTAGYQLALI